MRVTNPKYGKQHTRSLAVYNYIWEDFKKDQKLLGIPAGAFLGKLLKNWNDTRSSRVRTKQTLDHLIKTLQDYRKTLL